MKGAFSQVIFDLLMNVHQALDGTGEIILSSRQEADWLVICVQDDGCGMDEAVVNNIFDPFYTTKDVGVGTGLGLFISMGIVKRH